jgi:hypothetical protein
MASGAGEYLSVIGSLHGDGAQRLQCRQRLRGGERPTPVSWANDSSAIRWPTMARMGHFKRPPRTDNQTTTARRRMPVIGTADAVVAAPGDDVGDSAMGAHRAGRAGRASLKEDCRTTRSPPCSALPSRQCESIRFASTRSWGCRVGRNWRLGFGRARWRRACRDRSSASKPTTQVAKARCSRIR